MIALNVNIKNKRATAQPCEPVVCGNSGYMVLFDFDDEWADYELKTARFRKGAGGKSYEDVVFSGNSCPVPVMRNVLSFEVGVYAGDIQTTTPAVFRCLLCATDGDPVHEDPPEDVYNQLMEAIKGLEGGGASPEAIEAAINAYLDDHPIEQGPQGEPGEAGVTFTPAVDEAGTLSWTNDGGLTNPDPVNIKGPQGEPGEAGSGGEDLWEHILTYTEETGPELVEHIFSQTEDGTPFHFKRLVVHVVAAAGTKNEYITFNANRKSLNLGYVTGVTTASGVISVLILDTVPVKLASGEILRTADARTGVWNTATTSSQYGCRGYGVPMFSFFNSIYEINVGGALPIGSTITIYGVRA